MYLSLSVSFLKNFYTKAKELDKNDKAKKKKENIKNSKSRVKLNFLSIMLGPE